jgi:hypothetical protein
VVASVIPTLGKRGQEDLKLEASLHYIGRPCLKGKIKQNNPSPMVAWKNALLEGTIHRSSIGQSWKLGRAIHSNIMELTC